MRMKNHYIPTLVFQFLVTRLQSHAFLSICEVIEIKFDFTWQTESLEALYFWVSTITCRTASRIISLPNEILRFCFLLPFGYHIRKCWIHSPFILMSLFCLTIVEFRILKQSDWLVIAHLFFFKEKDSFTYLPLLSVGKVWVSHNVRNARHTWVFVIKENRGRAS